MQFFLVQFFFSLTALPGKLLFGKSAINEATDEYLRLSSREEVLSAICGDV